MKKILSGGCCLATGTKISQPVEEADPSVSRSQFLPQNMDVQLPQEDIGYVHAASFNDALTYIPFTPSTHSPSPLAPIHFHLDHPFDRPFLRKWESSGFALESSSSVCPFFPFLFPRPSSFSVSRPISYRRCFDVRFTSEPSSPSRHPTPHMPLRISYVYSPIVLFF